MPGHYTGKRAFYPSSKPEGDHANPAHLHITFNFQTEKLFGIKQQKTLQNSIQIQTTQNWKGTGTYIYRDCYSVLTHPALRCNLDVLVEEISTLFNYTLSLPISL